MNGNVSTYFDKCVSWIAANGLWFEAHPNAFTNYHANRLNQQLEKLRTIIVASKHAGKSYPKPGLNNMTFINTRLTVEQIKDFERWSANEQNVNVALAEALHDGYKITFQKMPGEDVFLANMYPAKDAVMNTGLALGARSTNYFRAVLMCIYKHMFLCDDNDWTQLIGDSSEG